MKGRTSMTKVTKLEPKASGLPGLIAILPVLERAFGLTAGLMWSSSPTETPPLVRIRSLPGAASRSGVRVASSGRARCPGRRPRSRGLQQPRSV
jgi:hypothetical protein